MNRRLLSGCTHDLIECHHDGYSEGLAGTLQSQTPDAEIYITQYAASFKVDISTAYALAGW